MLPASRKEGSYAGPQISGFFPLTPTANGVMLDVCFSPDLLSTFRLWAQELLYFDVQPTLSALDSVRHEGSRSLPIEGKWALTLTVTHPFVMGHDPLRITALQMPVVALRPSFPRLVFHGKLFRRAFSYVCSQKKKAATFGNVCIQQNTTGPSPACLFRDLTNGILCTENLQENGVICNVFKTYGNMGCFLVFIYFS